MRKECKKKSKTGGACTLQWGRNLTVAERQTVPRSDDNGNVLQWGRNLTVAESAIAGPSGGDHLQASMGPQLDSCGKVFHHGRLFMYGYFASMGPQLDSCGKVDLRPPVPPQSPDASMGPQLDSCGKLLYDSVSKDYYNASMGPQLDSCGKLRRNPKREMPAPASMGPQLDSCGKFETVYSIRGSFPCFNGAAT